VRKTRLIAILAATVCLGIVGVASADEPTGVASSFNPLRSLTCPEALLRGCCDNYCPKPLPCVNYICCICGPDDYCGKPCPCVRCFWGCCPDCYCRKPCPDLCRPLAADYFTCAGSSVRCAGSLNHGTIVDNP
jgi:hypothetical protein